VHAYGLWVELLRPLIGPGADLQNTRAYATACSGLSATSKHALETILTGLPLSGSGFDLGEAKPDPAMVADAITELFSSTSKTLSSIVIIDDLQWADADSLTVLRFLLKRKTEGLITIVMYCDRDITDARNVLVGQVTTKVLAATLSDLARVDGVRREALQPLDASDVASFVAASFAGTLIKDSEKLATQIFEETEGNPMFVAEVLHDLGSRSPDDLAQQMNNEGVGVPQRLRETIHRRIARLGEETLRVLSFAAVVGRKFDIDTLEAVTESDVLDDLDLAEEAGIITCKSSGRYEFSHIIIHEALLAELSATRRARVTDHIAKLTAKKIALSGVE
jgi:predicted ATPase